MEYRGYIIEEDKTGNWPKPFMFYMEDDEYSIGYGVSVKDCMGKIDDMFYNTLWI